MQFTNKNGGVPTANRPDTALVFDIGGTTIRAGIVDPTTGSLGAVDRTATPNYQTHGKFTAEDLLEEVLDDAFKLATRLLGGAVPSTIIAGYPGPVSPSGVALRSPTILGPALDREYDVKGRLSVRWPDSEIIVLNDLSCAGYGFVARGHLDFCVITVGSGIGNKVFLDGRPITGQNGRGGEIGHLQSFPGPGTPLSDMRDELGNIASGRGTINFCHKMVNEPAGTIRDSRLVREFADREPPDVGKLLSEAFRERDELAVRIVEMACYPLAVTIGAIHLAIGLESFFIVGGFAKALGQSYREMLIRSAEELTWDLGQDWSKMISIGEAGTEEALLGAAYLVSHHTNAKTNVVTAEV